MTGSLSNKMALGKSIKMYLTIFVATTCIYMLLYQYHMSRPPLASNEVVKVSDHILCQIDGKLYLYIWRKMNEKGRERFIDNFIDKSQHQSVFHVPCALDKLASSCKLSSKSKPTMTGR